MLKEIFRFEITYHLRRPLFGLTALVLFGLALMITSTELAVAFSHAPGIVFRNAPFVLMHVQAGLTSLGLFVVTAFVASSVQRDFQLGTHMLFFSRPITKFDYLFGRFAGSMVVSLTLFLAPCLGMIAGFFAPWQDPGRVAPFAIASYIVPLLVMVLPNVFAMGALFFAVAGLSRSMLATYICVVAFVSIQDLAEAFARDFQNLAVGGLLEPLGVVALEAQTRYWTIAEYNTIQPGLCWALFGNRLLWIAIGLLALGVGFSCFSYSRATSRRWWARNEPRPSHE